MHTYTHNIMATSLVHGIYYELALASILIESTTRTSYILLEILL